MVNIEMKHGLPFCNIEIFHGDKSIVINNVLIDTGSGGTVLKMDIVEEIGITIEPTDTIETIQGVGGCEFVYKKNIKKIKFGNLEVDNFKAEIGAMDYGFEIDGIIGIDFLSEIKAVIDLNKMIIRVGGEANEKC